ESLDDTSFFNRSNNQNPYTPPRYQKKPRNNMSGIVDKLLKIIQKQQIKPQDIAGIIQDTINKNSTNNKQNNQDDIVKSLIEALKNNSEKNYNNILNALNEILQKNTNNKTQGNDTEKKQSKINNNEAEIKLNTLNNAKNLRNNNEQNTTTDNTTKEDKEIKNNQNQFIASTFDTIKQQQTQNTDNAEVLKKLNQLQEEVENINNQKQKNTDPKTKDEIKNQISTVIKEFYPEYRQFSQPIIDAIEREPELADKINNGDVKDEDLDKLIAKLQEKTPDVPKGDKFWKSVKKILSIILIVPLIIGKLAKLTRETKKSTDDMQKNILNTIKAMKMLENMQQKQPKNNIHSSNLYNKKPLEINNTAMQGSKYNSVLHNKTAEVQ
ncbi:MAG: hypothetical protein RL208_288, partial [Pseudomonadota bacterium]